MRLIFGNWSTFYYGQVSYCSDICAVLFSMLVSFRHLKDRSLVHCYRWIFALNSWNYFFVPYVRFFCENFQKTSYFGHSVIYKLFVKKLCFKINTLLPRSGFSLFSRLIWYSETVFTLTINIDVRNFQRSIFWYKHGGRPPLISCHCCIQEIGHNLYSS